MAETRRALFKTSILSALGLLSLGSASRAKQHSLLGGDQCDADAAGAQLDEVPIVVYTDGDQKSGWILLEKKTQKGDFIAYKGLTLSPPKPFPEQLLDPEYVESFDPGVSKVTVKAAGGNKQLAIAKGFVTQNDIKALHDIHNADITFKADFAKEGGRGPASGGRWNEIGNS